MSSNFNLPISYLKNKSMIDEHIIDDIQLYDEQYNNYNDMIPIAKL